MVKRHPPIQIPYIWIDQRIDVPQWLAAEIGRIAVEWSDLEWQLEETIRLLVPTHIQHARIVTTGMNVRSRLKVAENLVISHFHAGTLPKDACLQFRKHKEFVERIEPDRHKLVHGLWGRVEGHWELLRRAATRKMPEVGAVPRAVLPQRERITAGAARKIRADIKLAREAIDAFRLHLEDAKLEDALTPSLYKSPRQIGQSHPTRARRTKAPAAPLPPFREKRGSRKK